MGLQGQGLAQGLGNFIATRMENRAAGPRNVRQYSQMLDAHLGYEAKRLDLVRQQQTFEHGLGKDRATHEHELGLERAGVEHRFGLDAGNAESFRRMTEAAEAHRQNLEAMKEGGRLNRLQTGAAHRYAAGTAAKLSELGASSFRIGDTEVKFGGTKAAAPKAPKSPKSGSPKPKASDEAKPLTPAQKGWETRRRRAAEAAKAGGAS